jgi:sialidase-1
MKRSACIICLLIVTHSIISCKIADKNPFWNDGVEFIEVQQIFEDERFPNVVVATDGTVVATWGSKNFRVRRSEDGGSVWGPEISVANPGFQGGGTTVDENSGDILVFVEEGHPVAPLHVYRSKDHGKTWQPDEVVIHPDENGNIPSMHMNERGITLKHGKYAGRLIRPTRVYGGGNEREFWHLHYTNAIYSDDGGKTWKSSSPFPVFGTGEAALEELADGTIYYNSRRHMSTDGLNPRLRYIGWSDDGGHSWRDISVSEELPDGSQHTDYGLMAGLVRLPIDGCDILLFSNIDVPLETDDGEFPFEQRTSRRIRGTVWASFDGGKTWPVKRLVDEGPFAYSSMAAGRKGTPSEGMIYLFYESGKGAKMARFNLAWVTGGRDWKEFLNK